jgi:hypothetical protein
VELYPPREPQEGVEEPKPMGRTAPYPKHTAKQETPLSYQASVMLTDQSDPTGTRDLAPSNPHREHSTKSSRFERSYTLQARNMGVFPRPLGSMDTKHPWTIIQAKGPGIEFNAIGKDQAPMTPPNRFEAV